MRICRFELEGTARWGRVLDDGRIQPTAGGPFTSLKDEGDPLDRKAVRLLVPILPSKLAAVGRNYRAHAEELGHDVPAEPLFFLKATSALLPPEMSIRIPWESERVDHEAELAVVISRPTRRVTAEEARGCILGYTCVNDVTARDIQKREVQFTRAKGFDTFAPLGPWIETELDPSRLKIVCRVNGQVRQEGSTADMVFDPFHLISALSNTMTLLPGDVVATGTPHGVGPLKPGDVVEVEIEGIGTLRNPVEAEIEARR